MKEGKRRIAVLLMAALLAPLFAVPSVKAAEEETEAASGEAAQGTVEEAEEEEKQPVFYQLDEENKDGQGIFYTIYEESGTACVGTDEYKDNTCGYLGANGGKVILPDFVEKDGEKYELTEIGVCAFYMNQHILHIDISDTVLVIPEDAFYDSSLQSIYIGKNVFGLEGAGGGIFSQTENLKKIEVDEKNKWYEVHDGILYDKRRGKVVGVPQKKKLIEEYQLPEGVKEIGNQAFMNNSNLHTLLLPDSVERIDGGAFWGSRLQGINLNHVRSIEEYAFAYVQMTSVVIGRAVHLDGQDTWNGYVTATNSGHTFYNAGLKCVDHKNSHLVESEFESCYMLDTVLLADDTVEIPKRAFYGCRKLKEIVIPPSVKKIDKTAFYGCNDLVIYGRSGSTAEQFAEEYAYEFEAIDQCDHKEEEIAVWEDSYVRVTGIQCSKCNYKKQTCIEKNTLKAESGEVHLSVFQKADIEPSENGMVVLDDSQKDSYGLYYKLNLVEKTATLSNTEGSIYRGKGGGQIVLPAYVSYQGTKYRVNKIEMRMFNDCHLLNVVIIPDTVTEIEMEAFQGCCFLNEVYLGRGVKDYIKTGFYRNFNIINLQLAKKNPYMCLENGVLYNKEKTKLIRYLPRARQDYFVVPEGVRTIGKGAFYLSEIDAIYLPESVKILEEGAFWECDMEYINCDKVWLCGNRAFYNCRKLKCISFRNVKQFDSTNCVVYCPELECVYLKGDIAMGESNFRDCPNLKSILVESGVIHYNGAAYSHNNILPELKYLIVSGEMDYLSNFWIANCPNLEKLYIPEGVTQIMAEMETIVSENMTWYTASGSAASVYAEEHDIKWVDTSTHSHQLNEFVFYEDNYVSVKGQYCKECSYGTDLSYEKTMKGGYPQNGQNSGMAGDSGSEQDPSDKGSNSTSEPEPLDQEAKDRYGILYILDEETMTAIAGDGKKGNFEYDGEKGSTIVLPSYVEKEGKVYEVKALADYLFYKNSNITQLTIPDSFQRIGKDTLSYSTLQKLRIGKELDSITGDTLGPLPELIQIEVSEENRHWCVEKGILYKADLSMLVCCPSAQKGICYVPETVTYISDYAFYQSKYKQILLNTSIGYIGEKAFYASSLTGIELIGEGKPGKPLLIGQAAFQDCDELQWCWIKNQVSFSQGDIFSGCDKLKTLFCSDCYPNVEAMDFTSVQNLIIDSGSFIDSRIGNWNLQNIEKLILGARQDTVYNGTFERCSMLKHVYIPSSISMLDMGAFGDLSSNLSLTGLKGGAVEKLCKIKEYGFIDVTKHSHNLKECIFYENEVIKLSCLYCEECGYAEKVQKENKENGAVVVVETDAYSQNMTPIHIPTRPAPILSHPPMLTSSPIPSSTPEPIASSTPSPSPTSNSTSEPTSTATVVPTKSPTPTPTPTATPTEKPTPMSTATPTATPTPTAIPTVTPTKEPTPTPTLTATPTEEPTSTPTATPTLTPVGEEPPVPTKTPYLQTTSVPWVTQETPTPSLIRQVVGLRLSTKDNKTIQIQWLSVYGGLSYEIYRKEEKEKDYRKIAVTGNQVCQYQDKTVKANRKYSYKIRVVGGVDSAAKTFLVNGMIRPVFTIKKGKKREIRYITICLKKYAGNRIQIYMKKRKGKYKKIKLRSDQIKKYKGRFKLRYKMKKNTLSFKIRTYRKKGKSKIVSLYSKEKKARV